MHHQKPISSSDSSTVSTALSLNGKTILQKQYIERTDGGRQAGIVGCVRGRGRRDEREKARQGKRGKRVSLKAGPLTHALKYATTPAQPHPTHAANLFWMAPIPAFVAIY